MAENSIPVCRDCGKPLDSIQQQRFSGGYITLWTCWEKTCLLNGVTLSPIQWHDELPFTIKGYSEKAVER